jgi:hypothetical protein
MVCTSSLSALLTPYQKVMLTAELELELLELFELLALSVLAALLAVVLFDPVVDDAALLELLLLVVDAPHPATAMSPADAKKIAPPLK